MPKPWKFLSMSTKTAPTIPPKFRNNRAAIRGVGLIEVLIAVLIMGIGMLGIAALQATSLRNSQSSLERSNAVIQSYAILDAMRANLQGVAGGEYSELRTMQCDLLETADSLGQKDANHWMQSLRGMLGDSDATCGQVTCSAANVCTVVVRWNDSRGGNGTGDEAQEITTVAHL